MESRRKGGEIKRGFFGFFCALLILGLPVTAPAKDPPNYAFVPNSGDASISKVDLINNVTVARYYTAPRLGQVLNHPLAAAFGVAERPFPVVPADWRTSRIAIDPDGNAWVLNTGVDCFVDGVEKAYLNGLPIQGTVVRIQGDTADLLMTSSGHDDILTFGTDQAVEAFPVGAPNDIPHTVTFDLDGNLWIGFHMAAKKGGYFQKYAYDKCLKTLEPVDEPVTSARYDIAPFNAAIDKNGVLWFASYGSACVGRFIGLSAADHGLYSFDTNGLDEPVVTYFPGMTTAYGVLVDNSPADPHVKVYATSLEGGAQMWAYDSTIGGSFLPLPVAGADGLCNLAFDKYGRIWMASSNNGRICWYNPGLGGMPGYSGGSSDSVGDTPVGIGMDGAGDLWTVVRESDRLATFTPPAPPTEPVIGFGGFRDVAVGPKPSAYADFTRRQTSYRIRGYIYRVGTNREVGLAGWTISLLKKNGGLFPATPTATAETDDQGYYSFTNLEAGVYKVAETLKAGWHQVYPGSNEYIVTLPDSDPCHPEEKSYDFENTPTACFDETAWAANAGAGTICFLPDQGTWATYVQYIFGSGTAAAPKKFELLAGRTYFVGNLLVYDAGVYLYLKYEVDPAGDPGQTYKRGYCPSSGWEMTEYHFQVADEYSGFDAFRTNDDGVLGSPIPGQFMNNGAYMGDGWFRVSIKKYGGSDAYIAALAAMKWCGYRCSRF